jgi:hypothetical protein
MPSSPTERTNRHRRTAAWVAFVLWTSFLFWRQEEDDKDRRADDAAVLAEVKEEARERAEQVAAESRARTAVLCHRSNEAREGIRLFLEDLVRSNDGTISEREQAALDLAARRFAPQECPPEPDGGS